MVLSEVKDGFSGVLGVIPSSLTSQVEGLLTVLKAVGIAFIVYVVYLIFKLVFTWKRFKELKAVGKKIDRIEMKLDGVLKIVKRSRRKK